MTTTMSLQDAIERVQKLTEALKAIPKAKATPKVIHHSTLMTQGPNKGDFFVGPGAWMSFVNAGNENYDAGRVSPLGLIVQSPIWTQTVGDGHISLNALPDRDEHVLQIFGHTTNDGITGPIEIPVTYMNNWVTAFSPPWPVGRVNRKLVGNADMFWAHTHALVLARAAYWVMMGYGDLRFPGGQVGPEAALRTLKRGHNYPGAINNLCAEANGFPWLEADTTIDALKRVHEYMKTHKTG